MDTRSENKSVATLLVTKSVQKDNAGAVDMAAAVSEDAEKLSGNTHRQRNRLAFGVGFYEFT